MDLDDVIARARRGEVDPSEVIYLADEVRRLTRDEAHAWELYREMDAARGRWKKSAYSLRGKLASATRRLNGAECKAAMVGVDVERLKAERDRAVADLEPMQRTESAALDEVVRLERLLEGKTGRPGASPLPNTDGGASQTPPPLSATRPEAY